MHNRHHRYRTAPALAVALAAGLLAAAPAQAAPTASPSGQSDVNGDGYGDLVTASEAAVSGASGAGAVVVNTGSSSGVSAGRTQIVTQNSSGVPGAAEKGDEFGAALATGDLNGDGYTDVVAGTPNEDVDGDADGGTVAVLWGSKSGLAGGTTLPDPAPAAHDLFGNRLAVGDFDGDGRPELAVGTSRDDVWIFDGVTRSGTAGHRELKTAIAPDGSDHYRSLAAGDFDGDGRDDLVVGGRYDEDGSFDGASLVYPGASGTYTALPDEAHAAATGDFDGDGRDDLLLGSPDDNSVITYAGTAEGLKASARRTLTQDSPGVPGADEPEDAFGEAVAVGDLNGDGYADAAVGAEFETIGSVANAGEVVVLRGSAEGLTGTGAEVVHQGTEGVPGANEAYDRFGSAVRLTDTNRDGRADLVVGAPMENTSNGALWSLRGSAGGVSASHGVSFSAAAAGLSKDPYTYFGRSMPTSAHGS
ncbi:MULTISPECIES: FG-GAP and VCBS repeat-containing protein [unclassified Streptomyces]|uniref:FG-GAP-like repeat-containing protein n=1 Tax=unclassified Streptomyces TaxID=2593676 RepID=UPI001CBB0C7C|nr:MULTISPECIES: FG-GAP and VCBS repeat-containing protein [unclassified Streptomyces]WPO70805.1 FG-GAP and VCBS repeat-containing protein [Streptomyces sp. KN37]